MSVVHDKKNPTSVNAVAPLPFDSFSSAAPPDKCLKIKAVWSGSSRSAGCGVGGWGGWGMYGHLCRFLSWLRNGSGVKEGGGLVSIRVELYEYLVSRQDPQPPHITTCNPGRPTPHPPTCRYLSTLRPPTHTRTSKCND